MKHNDNYNVLRAARLALKEIIVDNVKLVYANLGWDAPNFGNSEDYSVDVNDFGVEAPRLLVTVTDLQTDYEGTETRTVSRIRVALDNSVYVDTEEESGEETSINDISVDELAAIARWTELALEESEATACENESETTEYVDLGLPSGTLWAKKNADDKYYTFDEAVSTFGSRLPTRAQFCELVDYCDYHFDEQTKDGVFSRNGKELRFPAAGHLRSNSSQLRFVGDFGEYQSCSPYSDSSNFIMCFFTNEADPSEDRNRNFRFPVRCVKNNFK